MDIPLTTLALSGLILLLLGQIVLLLRRPADPTPALALLDERMGRLEAALRPLAELGLLTRNLHDTVARTPEALGEFAGLLKASANEQARLSQLSSELPRLLPARLQETLLEHIQPTLNEMRRLLAEEAGANIERFRQQSEALNKRFAELHGDSIKAAQELATLVDGQLQRLREDGIAHRREVNELNQHSAEALAQRLQSINDTLASHAESVRHTVEALKLDLERRVEALKADVEAKLEAIRADNNGKLEEMRLTVDEKLHATLEKRLGASFQLVSERLEQVHNGLGEMKNLANGVGDLKKVLSNVKTRGTLGEIQLGNLLEQIFTPAQYGSNVRVAPQSNEQVEFAIRLPGKDEEPIWLPIDAKFPVEDFHRLQDAQEAGDLNSIQQASRALEARIKDEARTIASKYIVPPHTTDFAIMYLPTEGLFAEVLRRPGLVELLQREHRIIVAGPTNLAAMLNSLQVGFRTLAIEKRSSEVWRVLGAVKTEFLKFGEALAHVEKKIDEAKRSIEKTGTRSRVLNRKLRAVEALPEAGAQALLLEEPDGEDDNGAFELPDQP